jgi:hypothetical protein
MNNVASHTLASVMASEVSAASSDRLAEFFGRNVQHVDAIGAHLMKIGAAYVTREDDHLGGRNDLEQLLPDAVSIARVKTDQNQLGRDAT